VILLRRGLFALTGILLLGIPAFAAGAPKPPVRVPSEFRLAPDDANMAMKKALDLRYDELLVRYKAWVKRAEAFNKNYFGRKFDENSKEAKEGAAEQAWVARELQDYTTAADAFEAEVGKLRLSRVRGDRARRIAMMNAMAKGLEWEPKALERLDAALNGLDVDGDPTGLVSTVARAWQAIRSRAQDPVLVREASRGDGPGLPGSGKQSFQDCTLFALATASGELYEVVAARATRLIEDGEWRTVAEREHSQEVIERHGLNGDEVIMLAESLGQAEVVRSGDFPRILKEGRPILVCVSVPDAREERDFFHQVVLTRSFQHDGGTWYEMQDSNLDPSKRRYLSEQELQVILMENGVAYRRDSGRTPKLLRPKDAK